ncbi:hypothetical protein ACYSNX_08470 [Myroides sp. LJL115]
MIFSIEGHHGTSNESANKILSSNYVLSKGDDEWLGDGVYFFINGVSSKTVDLAEQWAIAQSWDNQKKKLKYRDFCVIHSIIEVDESNFLDLTMEEGVEILQYLVDRFKEKMDSLGKKMNFLDGLLLNLAREEGLLPLEVVKGNFYIKFVKERIERINLRTSNCTICTVYDPSKNIISNSVIKTGFIK